MELAELPPHFADISPFDVQSAAFLRQMAALFPGIIYVFNHQNMSNEYANRSIAQLLGYDPEEIKAMGEAMLPTIVHPDDFDALAEHVGALQDLADGARATWDYRALHKDGHVVWLRSIDVVFTRSANGVVLRHLGIAFEITGEKTAQAEVERLKSILADRDTDPS